MKLHTPQKQSAFHGCITRAVKTPPFCSGVSHKMGPEHLGRVFLTRGEPHPLQGSDMLSGQPCPLPWTHVDVLLASVLGPNLGVLDEVQVSAPHGDGCVPTAREERGRRVSTRMGLAPALSTTMMATNQAALRHQRQR